MVRDFLKPDKVKIAYFICLVILLNILPVYPCYSEKHVISTTQSTLFVPGPPSHYYRNGTSLELSFIIVMNGYEWNDDYIVSDGSMFSYYEVQNYESISVSPFLFWTLWIFYLVAAYLISCGFSYYNLHSEESRYVRKKEEHENKEVLASFTLPCMDCGAKVHMMADYSGICPQCKRGYQDKASWATKSQDTPSLFTSNTSNAPLEIHTDLTHWDKYQENLDETCDTVRKFKINYPLVLMTLSSFFFLMTAGVVLLYSNVQTKDGVPYLTISGFGLVFHWLVCALAGFFIGKNIKKAALSIPLILMLAITTVYLGYYLGPMIFVGEHTVSLIQTLIIHGSTSSLLGVSLAMASVSRYYYS